MKTKLLAFLVAIQLVLLCAMSLVVGNTANAATQSYTVAEIKAVAQGIVDWKKSDVGSGADGYLINDSFLTLAGTTPGDWYPIGLGRLGIADNFDGYLAVVNDVIDKRYARPEKLDKAKSTEWQRISLAMLVCGGNPRCVGSDGNIDLIADGVYNRVDDSGNGILGKQGINGFIWGLIALDSMSYAVPSNAYYTRDDIILNILSRELDGGGWALSEDTPDTDITAMAVQALAPYYNSEKVYNVRRGDVATTTTVRHAVKRALTTLAKLQQTDGGYISWGTPNSESAVQVLVALCSLGKNPFETAEFVADGGKTVYDGIVKYRNADGGFLHSTVYDEDNPTSLPDQSNTMASEQALYGMAALVRLLEGKRRLYDFRPEQSDELKAQIADVSAKIAALTYTSTATEIQAVYDDYLAIEPTERSYVCNYERLSELLALRGIAYLEEPADYNSGGDGNTTPMYEFTEVDKAATDNLPERLTTANRAQVLTLYAKIRNSFDFDGKNKYYARLEKAKNEIDALLQEIDDIKRLIKAELYPFDQVSLADKKTVDELYARYIALSEYDRSLFEQSDVEGLVKAKTQVDNLQTALVISICAGVAVVAAVATIAVSIRKRKKQKLARQMPESEE